MNSHSNKASDKRSQWESLRKYVRNSKTPYVNNGLLEPNSNSYAPLKKKESSNGLRESSKTNGDQQFKGNTLLDFNEKNSPKQVEPEVAPFAKGSLLASNDMLVEQAKEREKIRKAMGGVGIIRDPNSPTLVNLDNSVKFNQGSLLSRNSDMSIEYNNYNTQRLHKHPSGTLLKIDTLLSRSVTAQNMLSPSGKTLLELDLKPDAAHTLALRNTNIKPLLSFVPGERVEVVKSPKNLLQQYSKLTGHLAILLPRICRVVGLSGCREIEK